MAEFKIEDYMPRKYDQPYLEELMTAKMHGLPEEAEVEIMLRQTEDAARESKVSNTQLSKLIEICEKDDGPAKAPDIAKAIELLNERIEGKAASKDDFVRWLGRIVDSQSKDTSVKAMTLRTIYAITRNYWPERIKVLNDTHRRLRQIYARRFGREIVEQGSPGAILESSLIILNTLSDEIQSTLATNKQLRSSNESALIRIDKMMKAIDKGPLVRLRNA